MAISVSQLVRILDHMVPPRLAESWDHVGLQIGSYDWPVQKICTALDPTPHVVLDACDRGMDLLVTHHPLFFHSIRQIDPDTPLGKIIQMALSKQLAIFCAHTNLDSVYGGVNDTLAQKMGLGSTRVLSGAVDANQCKLVVFVPSSHVREMIQSIAHLEAGRIGNYSCCTFRTEGTGTFLPGPDANPAAGRKEVLNEVREHRLEMIVPRQDLRTVVDNLEKIHPYETMAYDVYPLSAVDEQSGMGRVGTLTTSMPLEAFAAKIKKDFQLRAVKMVGNPKQLIETVALCSGSGSSLLKDAIASGAQAYVSGDLGYHTARQAQDAGIGLVDMGHFASEHLIVDGLAHWLRKQLHTSAPDVTVEAIETETDPFCYL